MVGRSNVGKSSLINALVRQQLARTSAAPGKTRLVNFFRVQRGAGPAFYLVDLPGFGYARGGDPAAEEFKRLTSAYFARARPGIRDSGLGIRSEDTARRRGLDVPQTNAGLRVPDPESRIPIGVLLLVDARHPGLDADVEAWEWIKSQPCPSGVIGTKVDKLTRAERARNARELESSFDTPVPLVSADTGEGLEELWKLIVTLPKQTAA